jgi:DNA-binding transcriptional LysR family regulator
MELNQLETFLAVAEERSFSRAAVRLHRTQPAVSQVIRKLEASIGETLFDRAARDGSLTDAGVLLRTMRCGCWRCGARLRARW